MPGFSRERNRLFNIPLLFKEQLSLGEEAQKGGREERLSSKLFPIIAYKNAEATSIWRHHRLPNASFSSSTSFFLSLSLSLFSVKPTWTHLISIKKNSTVQKFLVITSQSLSTHSWNYTKRFSYLHGFIFSEQKKRERKSRRVQGNCSRARSPNRAMRLPFHFVMWRGGRKLKGAVYIGNVKFGLLCCAKMTICCWDLARNLFWEIYFFYDPSLNLLWKKEREMETR